ncbi:MAG: hypothetical protein L3J72_01985, partial [Thermoplasmata archaeon]|nr:hypothetical protein [Thermoplasmata archaeon]
NVKAITLSRTLTSSGKFYANLSVAASLSFAPALGLLPYSPLPTPGTMWNASAAFTATGSANGAWSATHTNAMGKVASFTGNITGSDATNGTVGVRGNDLGTITLRNGRTLPVIALTIVGPFSVREGTIWVPSTGDLWSQTQGRLQGFALASIGASTDRLDVDVDAHGNLQLGASSTGFLPAPNSNQVSVAGGVSVASQVNPGPTPAGAEVQAQPETVQQAQSASNCLVNSCGAGSNSTAPARLGLLVGAVALLGIAALIAALVVARRRAPKPPTGSVAAYPPSAAGPVIPPTPLRNGTAPASSEANDPLGNLY